VRVYWLGAVLEERRIQEDGRRIKKEGDVYKGKASEFWIIYKG